jgi:hypothetical protein
LKSKDKIDMARKLKPIKDFYKWSSRLSIRKIAEEASKNREGYNPIKAADVIMKRVLTGTYYQEWDDVVYAINTLFKNVPNIKNYLEFKAIEYHKAQKSTQKVLAILGGIEHIMLNNKNVRFDKLLRYYKRATPRKYTRLMNQLEPIKYVEKETKEIRSTATKLPKKKMKLENTLQEMVKEING